MKFKLWDSEFEEARPNGRESLYACYRANGVTKNIRIFSQIVEWEAAPPGRCRRRRLLGPSETINPQCDSEPDGFYDPMGGCVHDVEMGWMTTAEWEALHDNR